MAYVTNRLQKVNGGRDFCLEIVNICHSKISRKFDYMCVLQFDDLSLDNIQWRPLLLMSVKMSLTGLNFQFVYVNVHFPALNHQLSAINCFNYTYICFSALVFILL